MAAWLFGLAFMSGGLTILGFAYGEELLSRFVYVLIGVAFITLGAKIFLNGLKRHRKVSPKVDDQ
jgi:hypothetical protein